VARVTRKAALKKAAEGKTASAASAHAKRVVVSMREEDVVQACSPRKHTKPTTRTLV